MNLWLDEFFQTQGPSHRRLRHHLEGAAEAAAKFGDRGFQAAIVHILRDCRNIPRKEDYESGRVDALGLLRDWPVAAYVQYRDQDFESLVMNTLLGASGTVLWAFINPGGLTQFLSGMSRYTPPEIQQLDSRHLQAVKLVEELAAPPPVVLPQKTLSDKIAEFIRVFEGSAVMIQIKQLFPMAQFAYVRIKDLISPLVYIDHEYVDELRAELAGLDDLDIARFALPQSTNVRVKALMDPTQRSVNFISNNKTLSVGPAQIVQTQGGAEVRFTVGANLSAITVMKFEDRLIIRNGIHRAFVLAKLGVEEIPCILTPEQNFPSLIISAYPAFVPGTLLQKRPPLLTDFLNEKLCVQVPLQRSHKIVKISADESVLPID